MTTFLHWIREAGSPPFAQQQVQIRAVQGELDNFGVCGGGSLEPVAVGKASVGVTIGIARDDGHGRRISSNPSNNIR
ncbi:hypothetical protein FRB94_010358 [Tulasnella sp. JGI-2019a]|nr:hypothetical protein FRB94_010358 [Tulasnella sp. JGI-2019a]